MKANVLHIVLAHFRTLKDEGTGKVSLQDVVVFYLFPAILSLIAVYCGVKTGNDVYSLAISVFAIFAALLLSVQIALFGIFQRSWTSPLDKKVAGSQKNEIENRRELLKELNTNISYLTVICCLYIILLVLFYVLNLWVKFELAIFCFIFFHFAMTLFMVIKRAHALFQREYDED